jgi:hypothetical protein
MNIINKSSNNLKGSSKIKTITINKIKDKLKKIFFK